LSPARCSTVFGLDVRADAPVELIERDRSIPTGRALTLSIVADRDPLAHWPDEAELISEQLEPDGEICFQIEAHAEAGYLIAGPRYGAHLIAHDGRTILCAPNGAGDRQWQRLLVGQVLPFAALLRGLEVFHASSVTLERRAIALLGRSRAGKTSTALELCRLGASFLADDVLAVELNDEELIAHPGTPVASVDRADRQRLAIAHDLHATELGVNSREHLLRLPTAAEPAPLGALFFIRRLVDGPARPHFEAVLDAPTLIAGTFNFVQASPLRLRHLLDVCAAASHTRAERVTLGPATAAHELAEAVIERLEQCG
jgi:hypothetical protein